MPTSDRARYRVQVWLDSAGNPEQAAVAHYWDDVKQSEVTWTPGPFDSHVDVMAEAERQRARFPEALVLPFA